MEEFKKNNLFDNTCYFLYNKIDKKFNIDYVDY